MGYAVHRWGVEIEAYGLERDRVRTAVEAVTDDLCMIRDDNGPTSAVDWAVVHDGSIRRTGEFELRTPAMMGENFDKLYVVCKELVRLGAKVGPTCGLHVHHDARYILKALVTSTGWDYTSAEHYLYIIAAQLYARMERMLDTVMPPSRRANRNEFCMTMLGSTTTFHAILTRDGLEMHMPREKLNVTALGNHHAKMSNTSMLRHGTLEYRQHSGTLNADKIVPWVKLTGLIHAQLAEVALGHKRLPTNFTKLPDLLAWLEASAPLVEYWLKRQAALAETEHTANFWECDCDDCSRELNQLAARINQYVQRSTEHYSAKDIREWSAMEPASIKLLAPLWRGRHSDEMLMNALDYVQEPYSAVELAEMASRVDGAFEVEGIKLRRMGRYQEAPVEALPEPPDIEGGVGAANGVDYRDQEPPPYVALTAAGQRDLPTPELAELDFSLRSQEVLREATERRRRAASIQRR